MHVGDLTPPAPASSAPAEPLRVLVMQSNDFFGSDSMIHSLLVREFRSAPIDVHVAITAESGGHKSPSMAVFEQMPHARLVPTLFGPTVHQLSFREVVSQAPSVMPYLGSQLALIRYARRHRIQIVHCNEKPREILSAVAVARACGARLVVHMHVKVDSWMSPVSRWGMRRADALIGVSRFVADSVAAAGLPPARVRHVLNSLDPAAWDPETDGSGVREDLGLPTGCPLLVVIGRIFKWKGQHSLIRAMPAVLRRVPEARLLIVGDDDLSASQGGSYKAELEALVRELGLGQRVVFSGWRTDVPRLLAAADVYAMATHEEPCAIIFLEAMAMRKPIVALNNGGTPELVEHGQTGLLSEPGDLDALAGNMTTLLLDPAEARRMGQAGRDRLEGLFRPARMAAEVEQVYRELVWNRM